MVNSKLIDQWQTRTRLCVSKFFIYSAELRAYQLENTINSKGMDGVVELGTPFQATHGTVSIEEGVGGRLCSDNSHGCQYKRTYSCPVVNSPQTQLLGSAFNLRTVDGIAIGLTTIAVDF